MSTRSVPYEKISEHFVQVSDHPGLLDTSELLRPEAILKEKVALENALYFLTKLSLRKPSGITQRMMLLGKELRGLIQRCTQSRFSDQ